MLYQIEQMLLGNHTTRGVHKPILIVNHISAGAKGSVINTFTNPNATVSSTFLNCRDGSIVQFVDIKKKPKTNGNIRSPLSPVVKSIGDLNPNYYSITIENEGYVKDGVSYGIDGELTEPQFYSLCWLHRYIQEQTRLLFNVNIPLNSNQVIGHYQIDNVQKKSCPGDKFPWARLYAELAIAESMTMEMYEERLLSIQGMSSKRATAYAIAERVMELGGRLSDVTWGTAARTKLEYLLPILDVVGLAKEGERNAEGVVMRIDELFRTAKNTEGRFTEEGVRKILLFEPLMREKGLLV